MVALLRLSSFDDRDAPDEVFLTRGAAAAEHDDCEHILEGLEECIDVFSPHHDADATMMQPGSEQDPDGEDDDDDFQSCCSGDGGGRDDDDDDDDLMSPFTRDAPAGPPLRGGEAPGTAAPALGSR